ncbi:MAG TPA: hypothetical protein VHF47_06600 [Acidimicrobiales bacterium]|nr:hypothetical protein [Acidimicrobiales bacterium]
MRRRLAALLSAALAASTLAILGSGDPAVANNVCAGTGTAAIATPGLFYPGVGTTTSTALPGSASLTLHALPKLLPFSFAPGATGACVTGAFDVAANGFVSGWCGHSWGTGITTTGYRFSWVSVGGSLVVTGGLFGTVKAVPDALSGQSCATGALGFIIAGAVGFIHCNILKNKLDTLAFSFPDPFFQTLTTVAGTSFHLTVAGGNYHVWHKLCIGTLPVV